jgi:hypothetical protein
VEKFLADMQTLDIRLQVEVVNDLLKVVESGSHAEGNSHEKTGKSASE